VSEPTPRVFRRDANGKPLWHAPTPAGDPLGSEFGSCQLCGEPFPCAEAKYDAGPVSVTGIWLRAGDDDEIAVLAEIDGQWRMVIATHHRPGRLLSYVVEPLGMRHSLVVKDDR
jgi:hypothetical protein